jgi:hypothetical protein
MKPLQSSEKSYGTRDFWQRHLDLQKESGLTRTKYCKLNKLNYHAFGYWFRKIEQEDSPPFVPVKVNTASESPAGLCTLKLETGHTLHIHSLEALSVILASGT